MKGSRHNERIQRIAQASGRLPKEVNKVIELYYEAIQNKLSAIKLDDSKVYTEEEFRKVFKSALIPRIGSLVPSYPMYLEAKKKFNK